MNGNPRISQCIQAFLLNTLVQSGVTQLQTKLDSIESQAQITVANRDGTVIKPLKQAWLWLMPTRMSLIRREPQQLHGMTGSVTELPRCNTIRQPLR